MLNAELLIKSIKNKNYNLFIKFIFDYILNPTKYLNFNWDYIIKNLNTQNIYERILFEMIIKLFSNIIFINYCNPLLIKLNCSDDEKYVASKQSNIFHDIDCSFAKKISKALQGLSGDYNTIRRVLISRAEIDMYAIRDYYYMETNNELRTDIQEENEDAYAQILTNLSLK